MLSIHDETLLHQTSELMAVSGTSDHRFYDRVFLTVVSPEGVGGLAIGMGVYKNMNAVDGFSIFTDGEKQTNVRVSRPMVPYLETTAHGLKYQTVRPFEELHLSLTGDHPLTYDLTWRSTTPIFEEGQWWGTFSRVLGRKAIDVSRYAQAGRVDGWIEIDGKRNVVRQWFGGRDHSWGVRDMVGGFTPDNGGRIIDGAGMLLAWFLVDCGEVSGCISVTEDQDGCPRSAHGMLRIKGGGVTTKITSARLAARFPENSRYYEKARIEFTTDDGRNWTLDATPLGPGSGLICRGGGYEGGWKDCKGHGVHRGDLIEHDRYLPTDNPMEVRTDSGDVLKHNQMEQISAVVLNDGISTYTGMGDCTMIALGDFSRFASDSSEVRL